MITEVLISAAPQVIEVKVKRRGAPEVAPTASEDLSAGTFVGGKEGDDLA